MSNSMDQLEILAIKKRISHIDEMFENASGWGSWMAGASSERKGLVRHAAALGVNIEDKWELKPADDAIVIATVPSDRDAELTRLRAEVEEVTEKWKAAKEVAEFFSEVSKKHEAERDEAIARAEKAEAALEPFRKYGLVLLGQKTRGDSVLLELWDNKITTEDFRRAASLTEGEGK